MRKAYFLVIFTLFAFSLYSQSEGSFFTSANCDEVFSLAKAKGKGSMIYFFEDKNSGCDEMESKVFTDASVQRFLSENFESIRVKNTDPSCAELIKQAKIQFFPAVLFFDEFGNMTFKVIGACPPDDMVSSAKRGLGKQPLFNWYKKEYEAGNRDKVFLLQMCYSLNDANELLAGQVSECLSKYSYEELRDELLVDFIYDFAIVNDTPTFGVKDLAFQLMKRERPLFSDHLPLDQVEARMVYIIKHDMNESLVTRDEPFFEINYEAMNEFRDKLNYELKLKNSTQPIVLTVDPNEGEPSKVYKKRLKALEKLELP